MKREEREEFEKDFLDCGSRDLADIVIKPHNKELKPEHYDIGIDTFQRMRANATFEEAMGFIRWNIDKYNTRQKGQDEEDYIKIESYCKEARWWFNNKRG